MAASERDISRLKIAAQAGSLVRLRGDYDNGFAGCDRVISVHNVDARGVHSIARWRRSSQGNEIVFRSNSMDHLKFAFIKADSVCPLFPVIRPWTAEARP